MPYVHPMLINRLVSMAHQVPDLPRLSVIEQNRPCISAEVHVFHSPGGAFWGQQGDRRKPGQPQPGLLAQSWRDGPFQRWSLPFLTVTPTGQTPQMFAEWIHANKGEEGGEERKAAGREGVNRREKVGKWGRRTPEFCSTNKGLSLLYDHQMYTRM